MVNKFHQRINETLNTKCTICGDKYNKLLWYLVLSYFCGCCIMEWIKKSNCPICRGELRQIILFI